MTRIYKNIFHSKAPQKYTRIGIFGQKKKASGNPAAQVGCRLFVAVTQQRMERSRLNLSKNFLFVLIVPTFSSFLLQTG
jgi:hypothetical protein